MSFALVLALSLAASPGPSPQQLFDAGDFEAALAKLDAAVPTAGAKSRSAIQLLRAQCLLALRRNSEIEPALELALQADPTVSVGEGDASPGFRATFDRVRARLAGTVEIDTHPTGGAVRIDGAMVGHGPMNQLLPVGAYHFSALNPAGEEVGARTVVVAPRSTQRVVLDLVPPPVAEKQEDAAAVEKPVSGPKKPWPVEPALVVRGMVDLGGGASLEAGAAVLGRYWLAELDGVFGGASGLGLRAGGRLPFANGLVGLQLTVDGVAFFRDAAIPGIGGTFSFLWHPFDVLDVLIDAGGRYVAAQPGFRSTYALLGLTLRARFPTGLE